MKSLPVLSIAAALLPVTAIVAQVPRPQAAQGTAAAAPLELRENRGQWPEGLAFQAHRGPATAWFHDGGMVLDLVQAVPVPAADDEGLGGAQGRPRFHESGRASLRLSVVNALASKPQGVDVRPGVMHYVRGEPALSARDVRSFERVVYREVLDGVDLVFRSQNGSLAYDFHVAGGGSSERVELALEGAEHLSIAADGSMRIQTSAGMLTQSAPQSFELGEDGTWIAVPSRFELRGANRYGFAVERIDPTRELRIDPVFDWSTFFGGTGEEGCSALSPLTGTLVAVCGVSDSPQIPAPWSSNASGGSWDAFVAVVDTAPNGVGAIWSALLGGSAIDIALDVAYDASTGVVSLVGFTESTQLTGFPIIGNAYDGSFGGNWDAFLAQFDSAGTPVYSSFFGLGGIDRFAAVEARNGILTIAGFTSGQFPIPNTAFQRTRALGHDIVLLRLDPRLPAASQIVAGTFLGSVFDEGYWNTLANTWYGNLDQQEIYVASDDSVWVATQSRGNNFPTTLATAYQPYYRSGGVNGDLVISHLNGALSQNLYSTYLGGLGDDATWNLHVEEPGTVTVAAISWRSGFPTTAGALSSTHTGAQNDFVVARLDTTLPPAQQLLYSTYVGGDSWDEPGGLVVEPSSRIAVVTGGSQSTNLPLTSGAYQSTFPGPYSGFALRLELSNQPARDLHYFSYFAAPAAAAYSALWLSAQRSDGRLTVIAETRDAGFPVTPGSPQTSFGGLLDTVVLVLDLLPNGATRIGRSTPSCAPASHMQVNSEPRGGNAAFELLGEALPPNAPMLLALGVADPVGLPTSLGAVFHVAFPFIVTLPVGSDARGLVRVALPIPPGVQLPAGVAAQLIHLLPSSCGGAILGASDALGF